MSMEEAVGFALARDDQRLVWPDGAPAGLSSRELEVVHLVVEGLTNREIAERLGISPKTVDNHLANIFAKVGVLSRTALATWAIRRGLRR
jgi:DNA-binding CsgD family transcriptional regulator